MAIARPWFQYPARRIEWDIGLNVFDHKSSVRMIGIDYADEPSYTTAVLDTGTHSPDGMSAALKQISARHEKFILGEFFNNTPTNASADLDKIATEIVAQGELAKMIEQDPAFGTF